MDQLGTMFNRACNPNANELDVAAIDSFVSLVDSDPAALVIPATKIIAAKVHSANTNEALLALEALEECCESVSTPRFVQEIGKFKFLNELIKLVSRRHLGNETPKVVQDRILDILFTWTNKFPEESKIKEAYDMLKTQGIVHQPAKNVMPPQSGARRSYNVSQRTLENEKCLKKLIYSKNPNDIEKANLLIQNMVREDERRLQIRTRRQMELKRVHENVLLLNEMLDRFEELGEDELQLVNELYETCQMLNNTTTKLCQTGNQEEDIVAEALQANEALNTVLDRHRRLIEGRVEETTPTQSTPAPINNIDLLCAELGSLAPSADSGIVDDRTSVTDELNDLFSKPATSHSAAAPSELLLPQKVPTKPPVTASKYSALTDLLNASKSDEKTSTPTATPPPSSAVAAATPKRSNHLDLDSLVSGMKSKLMPQVEPPESTSTSTPHKDSDDDEILVVNEAAASPVATPLESKVEEPPKVEAKSFKPLAEITIDLDSIQPSREPPRIIVDEPTGLKITLNFAKDRPREDVSVIVISVINQGTEPVKQFQFDASVTKPCKLRLLPPSDTDLPGTKPFRPPSHTITQILLLANPAANPVDLICILTYCLGDDPDPIKDSIEVKAIPGRFD